MTVYMVMLDWSTDDDEAIEVELYNDFDKAFNKFNDLIANEKDSNLSWAGSAFDKNGNVDDNYEFESHINIDHFDCWWNISVKDNWNIHSFIDLKSLEVQ